MMHMETVIVREAEIIESVWTYMMHWCMDWIAMAGTMDLETDSWRRGQA